MKICILQREIVWADPQANISRLTEEARNWPKADLYVLPEMFSTGFATHPEGIAEEEAQCASLEWMRETAKAMDCALAGSIATHTTDGKYVNRFHFVTPDGECHYDKHHLFTYSGEHERFTAGEEQVIVEWRGVRFRLIVCYDLRFPAWSRNSGAGKDGKYDCLLCVASWPSVRSGAWKALVRARAIENQCFVAAVNRVGTDPSCIYSGDSAIIDPYGEDIVACTPSKAEALVAEIDMDSLWAFREKFPVLADADTLTLNHQ